MGILSWAGSLTYLLGWAEVGGSSAIGRENN